MQVSETVRRERFSFAVARTLDLGYADRQAVVEMRSTSERLNKAEMGLAEGRNYLAARSSLRDIF